MCDTCGCNITPGNTHLVRNNGPLARSADGREAITLLKGLLAENDHQAAHNREHFDRHGVLALNLMSSPGSGKTALLEATIEALTDELRIAVIEGDLETENDAERIRAKGVPAHQIATGTACHLDAHMVHDALHHMTLDASTFCSSRTSAIWSARPVSISAITSMSPCCRSQKATTNRPNTR